MAYKTPEGNQRVWTYLPEEVLWQLREVAVRHRRTVPQEMQIAVEAHLAEAEREGVDDGRVHAGSSAGRRAPGGSQGRAR